MNGSSGRNIQRTFDFFCRKALTNKLTDVHRQENYLSRWETTLELASEELDALQQIDKYFVRAIKFGKYDIEIQDDDLWELLLNLSQLERCIVILSSTGMSDYKISHEIDIPRRTIAEKRKRILKRLRQELEGRDSHEERK